MSEGAVKVLIHRLRRRFRENLRAAIAETVTSPDDVDDEIRHLFTCLAL
jgi:RNA polymerase sigma-70 factor (ECF subfamily)